jgi:hypothetical protein
LRAGVWEKPAFWAPDPDEKDIKWSDRMAKQISAEGLVPWVPVKIRHA